MKETLKKKIKQPEFTAPLLVLVVFLAMQVAGVAVNNLEEGNIFIALGIVQLLAIGLPCIAYYLLKGRRLEEPLSVIPKRGPQLLFLLFAAVFFITGSLLIKFFYFVYDIDASATVNIYNTVFAENSAIRHLEVILSLIIIPAVCEEILFRGILFSEYRKHGTANAIVISALCFSMFHFSATEFPVYLFAGLLFGFTAAVTRSVIPSVALHLLSNTLNIYGSDAFLRNTVNTNGTYFVGFLLIMVAALAFILLLSRVETVCHGYAEKPPVEAIPPKSTQGFGKVFLSPSFLLLVVAFLVITFLV
ncbi:MAG: CPBP family intramembrane metalloprotease [Clostridia bacterium]|nr:CPBP family intramembrane metalloprotease [Clostridia bacterium]